MTDISSEERKRFSALRSFLQTRLTPPAFVQFTSLLTGKKFAYDEVEPKLNGNILDWLILLAKNLTPQQRRVVADIFSEQPTDFRETTSADEPAHFEGRPRPGGAMDDASAVDSFERLFPEAARLL